MPTVCPKPPCTEKISPFLQERLSPYLLLCTYARTGAKVSKQGHNGLIRGLYLYLHPTRHALMPLVCLVSPALERLAPYLLLCTYARTGAKVSKQGHNGLIRGLYLYLHPTRHALMPLVCLISPALRR